jgi:hypothetical protein
MCATTDADEREECAILEEFERDLPSVACRAAIELDNLILDRSTGLRAVHTLVRDIEESFTTIKEPASPNSLLNPTTAVVINGAIRDSMEEAPPKSISGLVEEAAKIVVRLKNVLADPSTYRTTRSAELEQMRSFCLALSRRASAFEPSRHEARSWNPFRR